MTLPRSLRRLAPPLFALLGLGCAQNAFLELQLDLPPAPTSEEWFAQTQVTNEEGHPFAVSWMGGDIPSVPLRAGERTTDCISVEGTDDSINLHVRVRFCKSADCLSLEDVARRERWYRLNHPFYIGRRTFHAIRIDAVPECAVDADCGGLGVCSDMGVCECRAQTDCADGFVCEECAPGEPCDTGNRCLEIVDRCRIEGCVDGPSISFCLGEGVNERHFCETNDDFPREDLVDCPPGT